VANWDSFDYAFVCPAELDDDLCVGYEKLLAQYRQETTGLDMSTSAIMRVAALVADTMRFLHMSRLAYGTPDGFANPAQRKNERKALDDLARAHDDYVSQLRARHSASGNLVPAEAVNEAVLAVLGRVSDARLRAQLQDQIVAEFEKAGI
jgi:hypothetical protein